LWCDGHSKAALTFVGHPANFLTVQSEIISAGQGERSFIEIARRAQIIECAINAIAELGYARASLAEIAKRAGVSKGVISYHFAGKSELMQQVVNTVIEKAGAVMLPRIFAEHSAAGMLRAYIESNLEFLDSHRNHIMAVMNISGGASGDDGKPMIDLTLTFEPAVQALQNLLQSGQDQGEFREFSTRVMAVTIRNAIDAVSLQLAAYPELDLKTYANELATLFNVATRK
jgi:TetR/AcrR family transcriptional regulator, fatty acid metabolism regulator protein